MVDTIEKPSIEYEEFPPITLGGPTGDYSVRCPVTSARWVEYKICSVAFSLAGSIVISGNGKPALGLDYSGGTTYNTDNCIWGEAYASGGSGSIPVDGLWRRITDSEKKLFVRIDTNGALFTSIQFRIRVLDIIPGPATTVHPDYPEQLHAARADAVRQRLQIEEEIVKAGSEIKPEESQITAQRKHLRYGMKRFLKGQS